MMTIDPFEPKNSAIISTLVLEIITKEYANYTSVLGLTTFQYFYSENEILKRANDQEYKLFQLINDSNQCIGFAEMDRQHLVSLYITKTERHKNYGKQFIDFIKKNNPTITVFAAPFAIEFYTRLGFVADSINIKETKGLLYMPMIFNAD